MFNRWLLLRKRFKRCKGWPNVVRHFQQQVLCQTYQTSTNDHVKHHQQNLLYIGIHFPIFSKNCLLFFFKWGHLRWILSDKKYHIGAGSVQNLTWKGQHEAKKWISQNPQFTSKYSLNPNLTILIFVYLLETSFVLLSSSKSKHIGIISPSSDETVFLLLLIFKSFIKYQIW